MSQSSPRLPRRLSPGASVSQLVLGVELFIQPLVSPNPKWEGVRFQLHSIKCPL